MASAAVLECSGRRYNQRCSTCSLAFATRKDLLIHHSASHADSAALPQPSTLFSTTVICRACGATFGSMPDLRSHEEAGCESETRATTGSKVGFGAKRPRQEDKTFKCRTCGVKFSWEENLRQHERSHSGDSFACPLCPASFGSAANVKVHMWKVHGDNSSLPVAIRNCVRSSPSGLTCRGSPSTATSTVQSNSKKLTTIVKSKSFASATNQSQPVSGTNVSTILASRPAPAASARPALSAAENNSEGGDRPFHCSVCDKRFLYDFSYNAHMNIHSLAGELPPEHRDDPVHVGMTFDPNRPFVCDACDAGFRYDFSLSAHKRSCPAIAAQIAMVAEMNRAARTPITITQFADLIQSMENDGEDGDDETDLLGENMISGGTRRDSEGGGDDRDAHNFSGFSDSEVRLVPMSELPAGLMGFLEEFTGGDGEFDESGVGEEEENWEKQQEEIEKGEASDTKVKASGSKMKGIREHLRVRLSGTSVPNVTKSESIVKSNRNLTRDEKIQSAAATAAAACYTKPDSRVCEQSGSVIGSVTVIKK